MQQNTPRTAPGVDAVMVDQDALEFQREDLIYGLANPRGEFVHFVVEGLDEHVPAKDHKGRGGDEYKHGTSKHRTITGAELRWVYRHRDASRVSDNILFWRKDPAGWKQCEAPWADAGSPKLVRDSWAAYGGHLMMNDLAGQLSRLQVDVDRMDID
jgi:hypothetical protein